MIPDYLETRKSSTVFALCIQERWPLAASAAPWSATYKSADPWLSGTHDCQHIPPGLLQTRVLTLDCQHIPPPPPPPTATNKSAEPWFSAHTPDRYKQEWLTLGCQHISPDYCKQECWHWTVGTAPPPPPHPRPLDCCKQECWPFTISTAPPTAANESAVVSASPWIATNKSVTHDCQHIRLNRNPRLSVNPHVPLQTRVLTLDCQNSPLDHYKQECWPLTVSTPPPPPPDHYKQECWPLNVSTAPRTATNESAVVSDPPWIAINKSADPWLSTSRLTVTLDYQSIPPDRYKLECWPVTVSTSHLTVTLDYQLIPLDRYKQECWPLTVSTAPCTTANRSADPWLGVQPPVPLQTGVLTLDLECSPLYHCKQECWPLTRSAAQWPAMCYSADPWLAVQSLHTHLHECCPLSAHPWTTVYASANPWLSAALWRVASAAPVDP